MNVAMVCYSDLQGGASRACFRTFQSFRASGGEARLFVDRRLSGHPDVEPPADRVRHRIRKLRPRLGSLAKRLHRPVDRGPQTTGLVPSRWSRFFNASDFDLVHLHWLGQEMISIADIGKIEKPLVWTFHDMWAFCGIDHYCDDGRWREGYSPDSRPEAERGLDLNRVAWLLKRHSWRRPIQIVAPSRWMGQAAMASPLTGDWPVAVIPYPIDTEFWCPTDRYEARAALGLPPDRPLLLFGAVGGLADPRKGFDLLREAITTLGDRHRDLELVVFGQHQPDPPPQLARPMRFVGNVADDITLRQLYAAADVMAIPSRMDNLPNTGLEAHACGRPVVAFDVGGLADIVSHRETGYLAEPDSPRDFAEGLSWLLDDRDRAATVSRNARARALDTWSFDTIADRHRALYEQLVPELKTARRSRLAA